MSEPIKKFYKRLEQVGRSKEIRLSIEEARELGIAISKLMAKTIEKTSDNSDEIVITGGDL